MEYYVYILYSESAGKFYIGQTNNIQGRLERHNSGTENATRPYRPWVLKWYGVKSSRADAMFLERKLKNLSKERLNLFIEKYK